MASRNIMTSAVAACLLAIACFHDAGLTGATETGTGGTTATTTTGATTTGEPTTSTTTTTTSTSGTTAEPTTAEASTGAPPACAGDGVIVLAVDSLLLGDTDPDGTANDEGWKQYGMDIDGLVSTADSRGLCMPANGASPTGPYPDGDGGIDNSFGKNVLPLLMSLDAGFSSALNASIDAGQFTYLLTISGLGDAPACTTASELVLGAELGQAPNWDGNDVWPVDPSSLTDPTDPTAARCEFPKTTIIDGQVLAKPPDQFDLVLAVIDIPLIVPLHRARLALDLADDGTSAVGGQISGILSTAELASLVMKAAATIDTNFCDPDNPTLQSLLTQMRQASDIMLDGTQDPALTCDGISVGLGFTMKSVLLGPAAPVTTPPADPCAPPGP